MLHANQNTTRNLLGKDMKPSTQWPRLIDVLWWDLPCNAQGERIQKIQRNKGIAYLIAILLLKSTIQLFPNVVQTRVQICVFFECI